MDYPTEADMDRAYAQEESRCRDCGREFPWEPSGLCPDCLTQRRMEQEPFDE